MTNFSKYDVVVVKFPFASSIKYKARPAVILSSDNYNKNERDTLIIMAISSKLDTPLKLEPLICEWQSAGLLKPSIFKASVATIEKEYVISKLGKLNNIDIINLKTMVEKIC